MAIYSNFKKTMIKTEMNILTKDLEKMSSGRRSQFAPNRTVFYYCEKKLQL